MEVYSNSTSYENYMKKYRLEMEIAFKSYMSPVKNMGVSNLKSFKYKKVSINGVTVATFVTLGDVRFYRKTGQFE